MPNLIGSVDAEVTTDFAILIAGQRGIYDGNVASFAESKPGLVRMECGTKYPLIQVRAERWDARPPLTDEWEDTDELPFEEIPNGGPLELSGFDPGDNGLDISGLGRGRVQVLARGRHRYHYGSHFDESLAPEQWLLRLYPSQDPIDPMSGPPRRIAGASSPPSPWAAAVRGLMSSGWSHAMSGSHAFYIAALALGTAKSAPTRWELAQQMVRRMAPFEMGGHDAESVRIPPRASQGSDPDVLAVQSGVANIETVGDAIDALLATGLLLTENRFGDTLLVVNPSPQPAWQRLHLSGASLVLARTYAMREEFGNVASLIESAAGWLPDTGLSATPRSMAIRWSMSVDEVAGGLRMAGGGGRVWVERPLGFDSDIDPDELLTIWPLAARR